MIYTLTLNPSLDYHLSVSDFQIGATNRSDHEQILPGGKGINVSTLLHRLGEPTISLGFAAGFTGTQLCHELDVLSIPHHFFMLSDGLTRINLKLALLKETEINAQGPFISSDDLQVLYTYLDQLSTGDILVLSGSIPSCLPSDLYRTIMDRLSEKGVLYIVDTAGQSLLSCLGANPFLIKPNFSELEALFPGISDQPDELLSCGKKLLEMGAQHVLISLGPKGAYFLSLDHCYYQNAPSGKVCHTIGSGDSMIAGFIHGFLKSHDYKEALKMAVACGSASAFSETLATKEEAEAIFQAL